jgi:hypothetical protein
MSDRSRSPRREEEELALSLFAPGVGLAADLQELVALHRGSVPRPAAPPPQGEVPNGALCDWKCTDAEFRDDTLFRLGDKAAYRDVLLASHATERCRRCVFKEDTHEYFVDGLRVPWSGTTFSHLCELHFNAPAVAAQMARRPGWAEKKGHVHPDGTPFDAAEIAKAWEDNGTSQSRRGTLMHWHIECHLNGYTIGEPRSPEFQLFLYFEKAFMAPLGLVPWRTEMNLFHCGLRLAGQADLVCVDGRGQLVVLDWKRSREIKSRSAEGAMRAPLRHLPSCNRYTYYLQLNTYRHMLESEYGRGVSGMYMVVLHPEQLPKGPHVYVVPRMELEMEALVQHVAERLGASTEARPGADAPFCLDGLDFDRVR